jgi:hypothetical protein
MRLWMPARGVPGCRLFVLGLLIGARGGDQVCDHRYNGVARKPCSFSLLYKVC